MPPHGRRERGCLPGICSHRVADAFCFVPGINPSRVRWRRRMIPSLLYSLFCSASGHRKRPSSKANRAAVSIFFWEQVAKFDDHNGGSGPGEWRDVRLALQRSAQPVATEPMPRNVCSKWCWHILADSGRNKIPRWNRLDVRHTPQPNPSLNPNSILWKRNPLPNLHSSNCASHSAFCFASRQLQLLCLRSLVTRHSPRIHSRLCGPNIEA